MQENGNHKTIQALHIDAQLLVKRLEVVKPGESVGYAELSEIIGQDVSPLGPGYVRLLKARSVLERDPDKRIVFGAVNKEGIKRLNDAEITEAGASHVGLARKVSKRGLRKLACVNYEKLSNGDRVKHNAAASHLGVLSELTKAASIKRISAGVEKAHEKLAVAKTLAFFTGKESA